MINNNEVLEIKILNIAAFLYASGVQFVGTKKSGDEVYFIFSPKDKAESLIDQYFSDTALINPKQLFAHLNSLRDLIFSGRAGK